VGPEKGHKNDQRAETPLLGGKAERVGAAQHGRGCGETLLQPSST